jgi:site-specific recombinase XerD
MDNDTRTDPPTAPATRRERPKGCVERPNPKGCFERPKGSGSWWIRYRDEHGRLHREKVGQKGLAKKVYAKRKTEIAERRFFPEQFRRRPEPLAVAIKKYVARRRSTIVAVADFERYGRFWATAPETAGKTTHELTAALIELVRERRRAEGCAESTWNKEVSWLRAFYGDLLDAVREHPDRYVPLVSPIKAKKHFYPETHSRTRHLSDDEEAQLRAVLPAAAWPKIEVAMLTGFDLEVQFGLRWAEDVNFEARTVRGWRRKGRGRKLAHYDVPMSDDLAAVLRALPSRLKSPWVFPNASGTNRARGKLFVRRVFTPALRRAQIADFRWKDLRHTFASRLRQRGTDIQDIRDLLGHTSTRMTERYAHGARGTLHAAVQRLNRPTEVAPGVAPARETPSESVVAGGENPKPSRAVRGSGRYWDRTSDPRLVRPMLYR